MATPNLPTLLVEFGTGSTFTPVNNDVVLQVAIRRGRSQLNTTLDSGTATVVLNNQSGDFDPSNTSSPWYSTLVAGMQVRISGNGIVIYRGWLESNVVNQGIYPTVSLLPCMRSRPSLSVCISSFLMPSGVW